MRKKKSPYLRRKMEEFVNEVNRKLRLKHNNQQKEGEFVSNVKLADFSLDLIWGGSSYFNGYLRIFDDLLRLKREKKWNWDYVFTLSESDFPIK